MAKGKRAVALFEVIHKDKRFERKNAEPSPVQAEIAPLPAEIPASKPVVASPELAEQAVELWRKRSRHSWCDLINEVCRNAADAAATEIIK